MRSTLAVVGVFSCGLFTIAAGCDTGVSREPSSAAVPSPVAAQPAGTEPMTSTQQALIGMKTTPDAGATNPKPSFGDLVQSTQPWPFHKDLPPSAPSASTLTKK